MDSKHYWDNKIIDWENSMEGGVRVSLIEKLASHFRAPLHYRLELAVQMLAPVVSGRSVLDLGCGSGFFLFKLDEAAQFTHATGVDISLRAIERAKSIAEGKGKADKFTFIADDVTQSDVPAADITVGLGFLDYLTLEEIAELFNRLRSQYFFFSFAKRNISLMRCIHIAYMLSQKCPKHFY